MEQKKEVEIKMESITLTMSLVQANSIIDLLRKNCPMELAEDTVNSFRKQIKEQIVEEVKKQGFELINNG